jgi:hypothetical protein
VRKTEALARLKAVTAASVAMQTQEHHAILDAVDAGASFAEIGEQMGLSRYTARHRIAAARKATGRTGLSEKSDQDE